MKRTLPLLILAISSLNTLISYGQDAEQFLKIHNVQNYINLVQIEDPYEGSLGFVLSDNSIYQYDGITWKGIGNSWLVNGNTIANNMFLGTNTYMDIRFKSSDIERMNIKNNGKIGINSSSPIGIFQVNSDLHYQVSSDDQLQGTYWSDSETSPNVAALANDDDPCTYWETGLGTAFMSVLRVDLGSPTIVEKYRLITEMNNNNTYGPSVWDFEGSNNPTSGFITLHAHSPNTNYSTIEYEINNNTAYRYYRIKILGYGTSSLGGVQIQEFDLFGKIDVVEENNFPALCVTDEKVGIGKTNPTEELDVNGNILANSYITPDYVFEKEFTGKSKVMPDYQRLDLFEVEEFIKKFKHLPGVPSAKDIKEQGGIILNQSVEINLEKIEELFLHIIEMNEEVQQLQAELEELQQQKKSSIISKELK